MTGVFHYRLPPVTQMTDIKLRSRRTRSTRGALTGHHRQAIAILDLPLPTPRPPGSDRIAAYRHWGARVMSQYQAVPKLDRRWGWWCRCGLPGCAISGRRVRAVLAAILRPACTGGGDGRGGRGRTGKSGRPGARGRCGPGRSGRRPAASGGGAGGVADLDQVLQGPAGPVPALRPGVAARTADDPAELDLQRVSSRGPGAEQAAQPCAAAVPSGFTTVTHQRVAGCRAAAAARSRLSW